MNPTYIDVDAFASVLFGSQNNHCFTFLKSQRFQFFIAAAVVEATRVRYMESKLTEMLSKRLHQVTEACGTER